MNRKARALIASAALLTLSAGAGAQRAGEPGDANESAQLPAFTAPVRISPDFTIRAIQMDSLGASYPRVIQLQHYAPGNGQLLVTFAGGGTGMPVYRSTDNGETFHLFSELKGLRGQLTLYELPMKMGEFPAGTIMSAGGLVQEDPTKRMLAANYSSDGGKTWQYLSTFAEGGPGRYDPADRAGLSLHQNPVFEPYFYADAKGRLVVFFSDERHKRDGYSQLNAHRVSNDGGRTWGDLVYDVAIPDGLTRPGMAVVTRANNGKFSPNGTLLVSARGITRFDLGLVGNGMMINRNYGEGLWTLIETPIRYIPNPSGYSQTMIPLGDGQEILQLVPVDGRMLYAKFKLPEKLPEYPWPFGPRRR